MADQVLAVAPAPSAVQAVQALPERAEEALARLGLPPPRDVTVLTTACQPTR